MKTIEYVFPLARCNLGIGKEPLTILCPGTIETKFDGGLDQQADQTCAQGHLHVQQCIKLAMMQLLFDFKIGAPSEFFVKNDKIDSLDITDELMFSLADDPGEACFGPMSLKSAHHWQGVADVTNCRDAQDAETFWR